MAKVNEISVPKRFWMKKIANVKRNGNEYRLIFIHH